jgi:hypothetical protein
MIIARKSRLHMIDFKKDFNDLKLHNKIYMGGIIPCQSKKCVQI